MDKRYITAFLLSLVVLLAYPYYLKLIGVTPKQEISYEKKSDNKIFLPTPSSAPSTPVTAKTFPFKNELFDLLFTNQGGKLLLLTQGDTKLYESAPDKGGIFGVKVLYENRDLSREIFQVETGSKSIPPQFVFEEPHQYRLRKSFFVGNDKPNLVLEVEYENLSDREKNVSLAFQYALGLGLHTKRDDSMIKVALYANGELRLANLSQIRKKPLTSIEPIDWHGLIRKYYALLIKPDVKMVGQETRLELDELQSELKLSPMTVLPGQKATARIFIYAGPQSYDLLKSFGFEFERIFSNGALGMPRVLLLNGLNFFYHLTKNYGLAILVITLLLKLLFTPLTHVSYQSMGKMQALQPKVKAIQKHYEKDPARLNKELMELYKRNRVNPMLGCLPMVLQIPVFISFYQVLSGAVEMKGANFIFWIHDLSEPDRLFTLPTSLPFIGNAINILPILMIGSMLWQQRLTPQTASTPGQENMMYLMPVIFGFVFYNLPSGLVLYWLVNNLLTIFHQLVIKRIPIILHHEDT